MTEDARARLKERIDLLGPNVWLELDEISFPRYFDGPLRRQSVAFHAARDFAEQHGALLIFLSCSKIWTFQRHPG